jgi:putative hydrolase of the HAD superfamily
VPRIRAEAVVFDYGLTLVTFAFPRDELVVAMDGVRGLLGPGAPSAESLVEDVLLPLDAGLSALDGLDEVDYHAYFADGWRRAGFDLDAGTLYRILDAEQRCWDGAARLVPDAVPTLDALRGRGVKVGLCSNAPFPPEMIRRQLDHVGVAARADAIVLSSDVGRRKPAPEIYRAVLDALGTPAARTLFVGDQAAEDYDGPRRVGMPAVLCTAHARHAPPPGVPTVPRLQSVLETVA